MNWKEPHKFVLNPNAGGWKECIHCGGFEENPLHTKAMEEKQNELEKHRQKLRAMWIPLAESFGYKDGAESLAFKTGWYLATDNMLDQLSQTKQDGIQEGKRLERKIVNDKIMNLMGWEKESDYDRALEDLKKSLDSSQTEGEA